MRPFGLPLARPLATAHGRIGTRRGWLVRLEDDAGRVGLGEATPLPDFGTEDLAACESALVRGIEALVGRTTGASPGTEGGSGEEAGLESRLARVASLCTGAPCALAALDTALHDLAAKQASLPLAEWLARRAGRAGRSVESLAVQALVGGTKAEAVAEQARAAREAGFTTYKLKLAVCAQAPDLSGDLERVAALREAVGAEARLRLDANEAWSRRAAEAALSALAVFDVDYVEQPVAREDLAGLAALSASAPIAVAADEALLGEGLETCLASRAARIFVVKPAALGGLDRARRLARRAEALGIRIVWSTLLDGAVSRSALWHLAAGLGPRDEIHGLATGGWLAADLAATPDVRAGRLGAPDGRTGSSRAVGLGLDVPGLRAAEGEPWLAPLRQWEAHA
ncbi:MAG: o-succinylbenzoate synthase [Deltaproteobacteria bacterium]|jgi:o-succinylbenzoate synthase|nr:o-succinylbenzoate synthase [Deltaproteobacteria bacterium]MBW2496438.1 o-succinylbenzoate synthase [Deltaproteobacteria bacterium]